MNQPLNPWQDLAQVRRRSVLAGTVAAKKSRKTVAQQRAQILADRHGGAYCKAVAK